MPPDDVQEAKSAAMVRDKSKTEGKILAESKLSMMTKKSVGFFDSMDDVDFEKLKSWERWVIFNSRPKEEPDPVFEPVDTRWAPLAPMTKNDWVVWKKWVDKKGIPKPERAPEEVPPDIKVPLWKLIDRIETLAKSKWPPVERPPPPYPPPKAKPKFIEGKKKCCFCFPTIECYVDYWRLVSFPVSEPAKKAVATPRTAFLAKPKQRPPAIEHCPIPPKPPLIISPRIKMNAHQWRWHRRRLVYFAAPKKVLPEPELPEWPKAPLYKLKPRMEELAMPRERRDVHQRKNPSKVKKAALTATASGRVQELAAPRSPVKKYKRKRWTTGVKKSALAAAASERVTELAAPKQYPEPDGPPKDKKKWKREDIVLKCNL